tara:strand:- start:31840 stop:32244 length:405 start_codon:yes stop_codon:yes gene_type:complete
MEIVIGLLVLFLLIVSIAFIKRGIKLSNLTETNSQRISALLKANAKLVDGTTTLQNSLTESRGRRLKEQPQPSFQLISTNLQSGELLFQSRKGETIVTGSVTVKVVKGKLAGAYITKYINKLPTKIPVAIFTWR